MADVAQGNTAAKGGASLMPAESNVDHVETYSDSSGQFRWRAIAANGEIVSEGEAHTREHDAARAAQGVFGEDVTIVRTDS